MGSPVCEYHETCHTHTHTHTHLLVKRVELLIFFWHCHGIQVIFVTHSLEVTTNQQKVDLDVVDFLQVLQGLIDLIQFTMATAFHCHFHLQHQACFDLQEDNAESIISLISSNASLVTISDLSGNLKSNCRKTKVTKQRMHT